MFQPRRRGRGCGSRWLPGYEASPLFQSLPSRLWCGLHAGFCHTPSLTYLILSWLRVGVPSPVHRVVRTGASVWWSFARCRIFPFRSCSVRSVFRAPSLPFPELPHCFLPVLLRPYRRIPQVTLQFADQSCLKEDLRYG